MTFSIIICLNFLLFLRIFPGLKSFLQNIVATGKKNHVKNSSFFSLNSTFPLYIRMLQGILNKYETAAVYHHCLPLVNEDCRSI